MLSNMLSLPIDQFVYLWDSLAILFLFCAMIAAILYASVNTDLTASWDCKVYEVRRAGITRMCIFQKSRRFLEEEFSQRELGLQISFRPFWF